MKRSEVRFLEPVRELSRMLVRRQWVFALGCFFLLLFGTSKVALAQGEVSSAQARTAQYVFVIDDSGSMSKQTRGGPPADPDRLSVFAVRSLLSMLDDADEVTVVRLNGPSDGESIAPISALRTGRAGRVKQLDLSNTLAAYRGQHTPCKVALDAVKQELNRANRSNVAQVVFFLTDGECTGEPPEASDFLSGLSSHEAGLFKFFLLRFKGREYSRSLVSIARATDGEETLVSAQDPTTILKPFASALSRSQGYEAYLLQPGKSELEAHHAARRVRLLAVAPDQGQDLSFKISPTRQGEAPQALAAPRKGVHQYADGRRYRYAALDYKPGTTPISISIGGAGNDWKVVAVPEYRLFVDVSLTAGNCGERGEEVQFVEVGASVCATVSLVNEDGEVVTESVAGRSTEALVRYSAPNSTSPSELPGNRLGDKASFTLERVNLERGDHIFRPTLKLDVPGAPGKKLVLKGSARTLQVSSRSIQAVPPRFDLGELVPGSEIYNELTINGNFPPSNGRMVVEGRDGVPECVTFELSGVEEGKSQKITPNQTYSLAVKIASYCGHASFTREVDTALRIEFDRAASSRTVPSVVLPVKFSLVNKIGLPKAIVSKIDGGKSEDLAIELTGNHKKAVTFKALIPPKSERGGWPAEDLDVVFLDEDGDVIEAKEGAALTREVTFGAGGKPTPLRLRATSDACCVGGKYKTELALVPLAGSKEVVRVPVEVEVIEAGVWSCWGPFILWCIFGLLLLLLLLYIANMFRQSSFLRRDLLASQLVPLRWDDWGEPEAQSRQSDDVKRMVRRCMPFWRRALNWLKANPLKFGLPGNAYYETVQLYLEPARDVSRSRVVLLPERDLYQDLRRNPNVGKGRMFACARGGMLFFAVPGSDGRLGRLQFLDEFGGGYDSGWGDEDEAGEDLEVQRLRKDELLTIDSEREADTAAGWRVG